MTKRVHEIAKERGIAPKELLQRLQGAGVEVKAVSSSVDEAVATRVLGNGDSAAGPTPDRASAAEAPAAQAPAAAPAPARDQAAARLPAISRRDASAAVAAGAASTTRKPNPGRLHLPRRWQSPPRSGLTRAPPSRRSRSTWAWRCPR